MTPGSKSTFMEEAEIKLRKRLENVLTPKMLEDDTLFQRFLTARDYDVDEAEIMLRNHINWRKVHNVDTILSDYKYPQYRDTYFGQSRLGFDKEGSRVIYYDSGSIDYKGLFKCYKKQELVRYVIYTTEDDLEQMKIKSAQNGIRQDQLIYIFNLENLILSNTTSKSLYEVVATLATQFEADYPERLKTCIIINASHIYTFVWGIIKPFLGPRTIQKLKVFGKDGWKEELLKLIDADVLPAFLGGNRTDPDGNPMCRTFVNHGLPVPEKYYIDKNATSLAQNSNAKKLVISRKSKSELKLEVIHPGATIEWEFELKSHDIGFSLIHKESASKDSKITELIPFQRIETDLSPESGFFRCEKRGVYVLVFDNTYSWMHQKEIYYIVSVEEPKNRNRIL